MPEIAASDGIQIHYELEGDASNPTLMLSNSLGTTHAMWDKQAIAFSDGFQILRYDTRGHGQSDTPEGPYTLERLGQDAVELMDALKLRSVHFCGLSLGGMTGMWLGMNAAERIQSLTLSCTAAHLPPAELWEGRIRQVTDQGMSSIAQAVLTRWFTRAFLANENSDVTAVRDQLSSTSPMGYAGCCAAIKDMDCRPGLMAIQTPCLVIAGKADQATPPDLGKRIANGISGSIFEEIENAAHLANIEQEDAFNSIVLNFLLQQIQ